MLIKILLYHKITIIKYCKDVCIFLIFYVIFICLACFPWQFFLEKSLNKFPYFDYCIYVNKLFTIDLNSKYPDVIKENELKSVSSYKSKVVAIQEVLTRDHMKVAFFGRFVILIKFFLL